MGKAQLARFAYFTIPITTMAAGWMGGIELGKIALGRDSQEAWLAGSIVPGGIMGIWTRNVYGGMRTSLFLGAFGYMYQWSTNNNLTNTITPNYDNPNMPWEVQLQPSLLLANQGRARNGYPRENWTLPQGPWAVLEEVGRQGGVIKKRPCWKI